ncbi:rhomboid family intramembrane serine protease [Ichthyenterobacterium sp. W332]|uniref:Rhomboid family intramembrane serine protease n=1 Tax=Microcosmobacter mediterraneus TaxID=3075607 RepID=A0ABU2YJQ0_9FLAO|nr:rhomboid family intramembrane serine protease [Ichthyenterobacterium sp. W332]MDT0558397.1 rhomboid family intramembrane serine protease [Ichthyenterobacterium sp. W332]
MSQTQFKYSTGVVAYPILFVLTIWISFWFQVRIYSGFKSFGIRPLDFEGLRGVIFSPFIHGNIEHLYNNTIPLFVLSMALFYFYRPISWKVIFYGILLSGFLTWLIGRPANHIGASGLIYVLVSFMFFKGIFAKHYRLIALSLIIIFFYGSMIWYVFPIKEGMSWEGHLAGLITGLFFALIFRKQIAKPERYVWEQPSYNEEDDPFMRHFDEDGNFIEHQEVEDNDELVDNKVQKPIIKVRYIFKKKSED